MEKYYKKWFTPLLLPAAILFVGVIIIPFIIGVVYSFSAWRGTYFHGGSGAFDTWVGFRNYVKVFQNSQFLDALVYTMKFTLLAVIAVSAAGLIMAMLISLLRKGSGVCRTIFFMPNLLGGLALGFIWQFIFQIVYSKMLFGGEGILPIPFLTNMTQDSTKTLVALVIMVVWQMAGYMMLIFVAGINNIPGDLYEAASIDGAGAFLRFRKITMPMLMPSFTIVLFLTLSNCFKLLDQNVALTDGNFDTRLLALQILRTTKDTRPPDYGLAQAQAVIFFILIAVVGLIQVSYTKKREVEM